MKTILILIPFCFLAEQAVFAQVVELKDASNETLVTFNDEGTGKSSITIQNSTSVPGVTMDKLYNYGHALFWNGSELGVAGSAGGWTEGAHTVYLSTITDSVGIGTTSPLFNLDVTNDTPGQGVAAAVNADDAGGALAAYSSTFPFPFQHLADRVSVWSNAFTASGLDLRADGDTSDMRFYTGGLFPVHERMRITADGYIGIGKTSPAFPLDVAGEIRTGVINIDVTGAALRVDGHEAIWHDGQDFSWGFGGFGNFFQDNVGIGGQPSNTSLYVEDYNFATVAKFKNTMSGSTDGISIQTGNASNPGTLTYFLEFRDGDGTIIASVSGDGAGGVQYNTSSDARLKTNISDFTDGLKIIGQIPVRTYEMISAPGIEQVGFLAQELQEIYPQAVGGSPSGEVDREPMMIDYGRITPILTKAIQQLQAENEMLRERLEALEASVQKLQSALDKEL